MKKNRPDKIYVGASRGKINGKSISTFNIISFKFNHSVLYFQIIKTYSGSQKKLKAKSRRGGATWRINLNIFAMPTCSTSFGQRAFSYAAPQIWNNIPLQTRSSTSIESFKRKLKSHFWTSLDLSVTFPA